MKRRFGGWVLVSALLICVGAAYAAGRQIKRAATVAPAECSICCGDNLDLCAINNTPDGLILEFGRPVSNAFFWLKGSDARIDVWLRRQDIGNLDRAQTYLPNEGADEMGIGISFDPPYVAVRLVGHIVTVEDVVYGD